MTLTTRLEDCLACNEDGDWAAFERKYTRASIIRGLAQDACMTQREWLECSTIKAGFVHNGGPLYGYDDWYSECARTAEGAIKVWIVTQ